MQGKHHLEIGKRKNRPALCSQKYRTYILSIFALTQRTGLFFYFPIEHTPKRLSARCVSQFVGDFVRMRTSLSGIF